jgi:hypothetical protein
MFSASDFSDVRRAFAGAAPMSMRQAWLRELEPGFAPAVVRAGWRDETLFVFGELTDADIFTNATDHNQRFWELGDTFEVFLRPVEQAAYVELHVAPNNLRLQLRFPDAGWLASMPKDEAFAKALIPKSTFQSYVWLHPDAGQWCVLAEVPAAAVCARAQPLGGTEWRFSFSRYDYTRGREAPVISSTSPHAAPSFHRQEEWGTLRFRRADGGAGL